jgi:hypothetical protein
MTNIISGMPSYFWLTSSRLRKPLQDDVPYTTEALQQDLLRVQNAWEDSQATRDRNAIYGYLSAVFDLVTWWKAEHHAVGRAHRALWLQGADSPTTNEPFAAIIRCTSDPGNVDKRTRSKWSRVLRYALKYKSHSEPLERFIKRNRGINACAGRLAKCPSPSHKTPGE